MFGSWRSQESEPIHRSWENLSRTERLQVLAWHNALKRWQSGEYTEHELRVLAQREVEHDVANGSIDSTTLPILSNDQLAADLMEYNRCITGSAPFTSSYYVKRGTIRAPKNIPMRNQHIVDDPTDDG